MKIKQLAALPLAIRSITDRIRATHDSIAFARSLGVQVGEECRLIAVSRATFGSEPYLVRLGHRITVAAQVRFLTHDGGVWVRRPAYPTIDVMAPVTVGDGVFIGLGTILLPGVTVGSNSVIGAGSVVATDIPPDTVAARVPAKPLRSIEDYKLDLLSRAVHDLLGVPEAERRRRIGAHFPLGPAESPDTPPSGR